MRARSVPEITSVAEARALLGLASPVTPEALKTAFRAAITTAENPDHYRRVIAAWRLLQIEGSPIALAAPIEPVPPDVSIALSPAQALTGDDIGLHIAGCRLSVQVPAGVRTGDRIRLKGVGLHGTTIRIPVVIRSEGGLSVVGDDLHMTLAVSPRLLSDGGRIEIDTHAGPRSAWITPGLPCPLRLRLRDLGLPPRGRRPQGHLFVRLEPSVEVPTPAEALLARFSRAWAPERLAA